VGEDKVRKRRRWWRAQLREGEQEAEKGMGMMKVARKISGAPRVF
jgi:hypothetical protein